MILGPENVLLERATMEKGALDTKLENIHQQFEAKFNRLALKFEKERLKMKLKAIQSSKFKHKTNLLPDLRLFWSPISGSGKSTALFGLFRSVLRQRYVL